MIRLLIVVALLGLAMLLGPVLANNPGYLMLVVGGRTIEATLVGVALAMSLALILLMLAWWLLKRLFHIRHWSFSFLRSRREKRARMAYDRAVFAFATQDFSLAHQHFNQVSTDVLQVKNRQILAIYAAFYAGDFDKVTHYLQQLDADEPSTAVVRADLLLRQHQAIAALDLLKPWISKKPKDADLGQIWLQALFKAEQWVSLFEQFPLAFKHQWLSKSQWQSARYQWVPMAVSALIRAGNWDEQASYWSALPAKERKSFAVFIGKAHAMACQGQADQAEKLLLEQLTLQELPYALKALMQIPLGRSVVALRKQVQLWLRDHSEDAHLYALLAYCAEQEGETEQAKLIWQKALQHNPRLSPA